MSDPLISVIIPVYNVEKYLNQCIESVVNQTYKNLEIILVDDGSSDHCPQMCDEWATKDKRIKVIHKNNEGAAIARNTGLGMAKGAFIGFVDSDDFIDPTMYQMLYDSIVHNNSDIAICASRLIYWNHLQNREIYLTAQESCLTARQMLKYLYCDRLAHHVIWNKLYRSCIWKNVKFPNLRKQEDEAVLPYLYDKAEKISIVNKVLYNYRIIETGIMGEGFSAKNFVYVSILEKQYVFFKNKKYNEIAKLIFMEYVHTILIYYVKAYYLLKYSYSDLRFLRKKFLRISLMAIWNALLERYRRVALLCFVFLISPQLYIKIAPHLGIDIGNDRC